MARAYTADEIEQISLIRNLLRSGEAASMREGAGISRSELAGVVQCHPSAIMRWESALRVPRPEMALQLANAYGDLASMATSHSEVA